jgi:Fic family protein
LTLADHLFASPAISVSGAATVPGVTHRAAQLTVNKLVDRGIVKEVTGRKRNRLYIATEIVHAVQ